MIKFFLPLMAMVTSMTPGNLDTQATPDRPLRMVVTEQGKTVEIRVYGASSEPVKLQYDLMFQGDSNSRNRGTVRLSDGTVKTLSTVRMSTRGPWKATLIVTGDRTYEEVAVASAI